MEKPVVFENKRGKQLIGILHIPKGKRKWPLVVICHGFGATKTTRMFLRIARALAKKGIAVFRFDFEGCGDSEGELEKTTVRKQVSDLEAVMKWILKQENININKIAFLGHSLGCLIAALFIGQNKFSAKTLVFLAPGFNQAKLFPIWNTKRELRDWKKKGYYIRKDKKLGIAYLKENEKKDYSSTLDKVKIPILVIHGKGDDVVPVRFSRQLVKKYKNLKLVTYPKTDHNFEDHFVQQKLIKETTRWLSKYLK